ncbi:MAG: nitrous oxide reductase accessory protein NosL [Thermodesulfobacteriota bacterium]
MKRTDTQNGISFLLLCLLLLSASTVAQAGDKNQCLMCGMKLENYSHVRYTVTDTSSKQYVTCGVQCGLLLQVNLAGKFKNSTMTDLISHRTIPAEKGWYVFKSSAITDMAPGLIGFWKKSEAEKFIKGFGGELLEYDQALARAQKGYR